MLLAFCVHKSDICENSGSKSWAKSNFRVLKSATSQEQLDHSAKCFCANVDWRKVKGQLNFFSSEPV